MPDGSPAAPRFSLIVAWGAGTIPWTPGKGDGRVRRTVSSLIELVKKSLARGRRGNVSIDDRLFRKFGGQRGMNRYHPLQEIDSVVPILSKISLWGGLTDEQQAGIYRRLEIGAFKKGDVIFSKGDEPLYIYIVKAGVVEIVASGEGVSLRKEAIDVGGCFGVIALMAVQRYAATAMAAEDTELMVLSRQGLLDLYHEDTRLFALLMMNIAREIARKLTATDVVLLECVHELEEK